MKLMYLKINMQEEQFESEEKRIFEMCSGYVKEDVLCCPCKLKYHSSLHIHQFVFHLTNIIHPLVKPADSHEYYCDNSECPSQKIGKLTYFCSRLSIPMILLEISLTKAKDMDIAGVGPSVAAQLIQEGLINDVADLFYLKEKRDHMLKLERWDKKRVDTLLQQIEFR